MDKYVTTFFDETVTWILPEGATAYTAGLDGDELVLVRIGNRESREIPAGTPVIIVADRSPEDGDFATKTIPLILSGSQTVSPREGNILKGAKDDIAVTDGKIDDKAVYVLGVVDGTLGFYPFKGNVIPAGKAYILK